MRVFIPRALALLVVFAASFALPATAEAPAWRIAELKGVVRVAQPGSQAREARIGQDLAIGAVITTSRGAMATLENGPQSIVISENSRTTINPPKANGHTSILQGLGSALFKVDRRESQHFEVETPLLAAVVKGTTFTVTAGPQQDMVHVSAGLVEVRALNGMAKQDVAPGQTIRILRNAPSQLDLTVPSTETGSIEGLTIPAIDVAETSDHLFAAPGAAVAATVRNSAAASNAAAAGERGGNAHLNNPVAQANSAAVMAAAAHTPANGLAFGPGGNAGGNGNGNAGGNGNGNAGGNGNGNAGGNGNGNAGGNGNGNAGGNGNGNAGGNGNGNAGGNGNGNAGGNGNGNAGGNGNGNAGGNGNGNAGGNGNGNAGGNGNGNAGGNGNGNAGGNGNGNAGGNGNGNAGGNGNGNAGGNGNGNAGGNGNGNAGGNGNGNAGGNGNGNAGGNGNGNAGGNGNGNAGGNGNGNAGGPGNGNPNGSP